MRKIISIILSLAIVFAMSTTIFAAEIYDDSENKTASSEIVYNLESGYCIEIPEQIDASTGSYTFSAFYVNLSETEQVVVRISGVSEVSQLELFNDAGDSLTFGVVYDGAVIVPGYVVAIFTDSATADGALEITPDMGFTAHRAGEYRGTFEFTVSVEPRK